MMVIAERTNDAALCGGRVRQIEEAYETTRSGGQEQWSAEMEMQLTKASSGIRDGLKGR